MTQMNLSTKQKQTHRHREQGERGMERLGIYREVMGPDAMIFIF